MKCKLIEVRIKPCIKRLNPVHECLAGHVCGEYH